jgi:hypothetical protein
MKKAATIFDHLANITFKKTDWNTLSELDQKSFSPYLINRWLSMNPDLIEIVDMFQQYTIGPLNKKHVYQLYYDILPKQKMYSKYIKGKKAKDYNKDLLGMLTQHYQISKRDAKTYIDFWKDNGVDDLKNLLKDYGKTEKEIKQWLK